MPGFLTTATNNAVLDLFFGRAHVTVPDILYFGLSLVHARRDGWVVEPGVAGYARVPIPNTLDGIFSSAKDGTKSNLIEFTFPAPIEEYGPILSLFVASDPEGGWIIAAADLATPRMVRPGDSPPVVAVGGLLLFHC